ncbi:hypothetical protein BD410DRAFT_702233, partial [Rickenella mellea]
HKLLVTNRPPEVSTWLSYGRNHDNDAVIEDVEAYGNAWRSWWGNLQPLWRETTSWPFSRPFECTEREWALTRRAGKNGFLIVILSLVWWN